MSEIKILAPAKINLFLDIVNIRDDGYHNIRSIMQTVSLYDEITVSKADSIILTMNSGEIPSDESNLAYKAAKLFFDKSGIKSGCKINLNKNIPVSSGLAGGSTDAAAVLKALNKLYNYPLTKTDMVSFSSVIGADIPFCIQGGTCLCEGIGERLKILKPVKEKIILIVRGGEGVSTPKAYKMLDSNPKIFNQEQKYSDFIDSIESNWEEKMYNIFESAVLSFHSCANQIKKDLLEKGAKVAMLSGSGPAVFGIFDNISIAKDCQNYFIEEGYKAFLCKTI